MTFSVTYRGWASRLPEATLHSHYRFVDNWFAARWFKKFSRKRSAA